jgi:sulfite reductase alpha subunit-like flavoprotein
MFHGNEVSRRPWRPSHPASPPARALQQTKPMASTSLESHLEFKTLDVVVGSKLTLEALLIDLPSFRPRHFRIASSTPSTELVKRKLEETRFALDLCVTVVQGRAPVGQDYPGLCSEYLSRMMIPSEDLQPL